MVRRTKQDAEETRNALIDAAEQQFVKRGVGATSLDAIAKAAGVTRGALYHHFQNKSELVSAMMERAVPKEGCDDQLCFAAGYSAIELSKQRCKRFLTQLSTDKRLQTVQEIAHLKCEMTEANMAVYEYYNHFLRNILTELETFFTEAKVRGELADDADPQTIALGLFSILHGLVGLWLLKVTDVDLASKGLASVELFYRGIPLKN